MDVSHSSGNHVAEKKGAEHATPYLIALVVGALPLFVFPQAFAIPVIVMLTYLVVGLRIADKEHQVFEFADSFYYLGFALSMASLLAALEPFGPDAAHPDPSKILHRFGLGMFTTLIGVGGRTVLQMFYRLPQESLEQVNQRLLQETNTFVEALGSMRGRIESELTSITTATEQHRKAAEAALSGQLVSLKEALGSIRLEEKEVALALKGLSAPLKILTTRTEEFGGALATSREGADALAQSTGHLATRIGGEGEAGAPGSLSVQVAHLSARLDGLRSSLLLDTQPAQRALDSVGRSLAGSAEAISAQFASSADRIESLAARLGSVGVEPLEAAVSALSAQIVGLGKRIGEEGEALRDGELSALRNALGNASTEAQKFNALLDQVADAVTTKLDRLR